jgi:uncharacterized protein (TIGR00255 family)
MRSMTGFGAGQAELGESRIRLEIRALNHRHQEVRVRLPAEWSEHAFHVEQQARSQLGRGRYDVAVRVEGPGAHGARVDLERLRSLFVALQGLQETLAPDAPLSIASLVTAPGVIVTEGPARADASQALDQALRGAVAELERMRETEGESLKVELAKRASIAEKLAQEIAGQTPLLAQEHRERLKQRLGQILENNEAHLSQGRLEVEVALLAERGDVTEELVRLKSHIDQLRSLLHEKEPVGRKLEFLLQEMGREANTLGSKAQQTKVSYLVIELKSEIEKLREQVLNVE